MSVQVRLNVYSQRPDPVWVLSDAQVSDLLSRVHSLKAPFGQRGRIARLGYRGFSISGLPESFTEEMGAAKDSNHLKIGGFEDERGIEEWLLDSLGKDLSPAVVEHVRESIKRGLRFSPESPELDGSVCPGRKAEDAPSFSPNDWDIRDIRRSNNCYNYANNQKLKRGSIPGHAHGVTARYDRCSNVLTGALADTLARVPDTSLYLGDGYGWYVALALWPGQDAHWFRQDASGCWSHKSGRDFVSNLDDRDQPIVDPRHCDRGQYVQFCEYMVTKRGIRISGPLDE